MSFPPPGSTRQEPSESVEFLVFRIVPRKNLAEKGVEVHIGAELVSEELASIIVFQPPKSFHRRLNQFFQAGMVFNAVTILRLVKDRRECLHLRPMVNLHFVHLEFQGFQVGGVGLLLEIRLVVIWLESSINFIRVVHEIQNEWGFFSGVGSVQAGKGLDRLDARQSFVHIHGLEQGLVESGLVFVGDQ